MRSWGWSTHEEIQYSSVQSLSRVRLFATPWTAARQASLSITNSRSLLKLMSIESVMPSSHLILCRPLLLPPPISPSIRVFSNESALRIRWPKYWSFSFRISPSNEHPGLISFRRDWLDLLAVQGTLKSLLNTTVQKHQFFSAQLSPQSNSHIHTWPLEISALLKRDTRELALSLHHMSDAMRRWFANQEEGLHQKSIMLALSSRTSQSPELQVIDFSHLSHPAYDFVISAQVP